MFYSNFVITVALASLPLTLANTDHSTSRLNFHLPHKLFKDEGYDHRQSTFGAPSYGGSISQYLFYAADMDVCSGNLDPTGGYPARPEDPTTGKKKEWPSPFVLMIDRGPCSFVKQVQTAQAAGAAAVIVADTSCLCSDTECMEQTGSEECESEEPILSDDGKGWMVSVPSVLMPKHDADTVKSVVMSGQPVLAEMEWSVPSLRTKVDYELWTLPTEKHSAAFIQNLKEKEVVKVLSDRTTFTPHVNIFDGREAGCTTNNNDDEQQSSCANKCTNGGRYCAIGSVNKRQGTTVITGEDTVRESLRRICIWNTYGSDGFGTEWWDYVSIFSRECLSGYNFGNPTCISSALEKARVDSQKIDECISNSGGLDNDRPNPLLENELALMKSRGIVAMPSLVVNDGLIEGYLNEHSIFASICAGYDRESMPYECTVCSECSDIGFCLKYGACQGIRVTKTTYQAMSGTSDSSQTRTPLFTLLLVGMVGVGLSLGFWYHKKTEAAVRDQVRDVMAEYMPLSDGA